MKTMRNNMHFSINKRKRRDWGEVEEEQDEIMAIVMAEDEEEEMSMKEYCGSNSIPQDIIVDILSRIPAEALLRFKTVCNTWHSLISDPSPISTPSALHITPFCLQEKTTLLVHPIDRLSWKAAAAGGLPEPEPSYDGRPENTTQHHAAMV